MNSKEKLTQYLQIYRDNVVERLNNKEEIDFTVGDMEFLNDMIQKAKDGYYSDYDSPLAMPCHQLIQDLTKVKANALAALAKNGHFNATKEESDAWYEREGKKMIEDSVLPKELFENPVLEKRSKEETEAKEGIKG